MLSNSRLVNLSRQKDTLTENGAVTNSTSLNPVVDLFFLCGASRSLDEATINKKIAQAYGHDPKMTVRMIFYAGDVRGGLGERRFFRIALKWLDQNASEVLVENIKAGNVEFYNRWDSLFELRQAQEAVLGHVERNLLNGDGRLAKWLPRRGQYNNFAGAFRDHMGWSPKQYRKFIVKLSDTVEQDMCAKRWGDINYEHVPSVAMNKYRKAFSKHDCARFGEFINAVKAGEAKINAGAIFPYDIYRALKRGDNAKAVEAQWENLPDFMGNNNFNILPMCDVSGSMNGLPLDISVSLGIYISERNQGLFKDAFLTFSGAPTIQHLQGSFSKRVAQLERAQWDTNTNFQAAFDLILATAVKNRLRPDEMPDLILTISDMEFDSACRGHKTNFEAIEEKYEQAGYTRPNIVFWNVNARSDKNVPIKYDQHGTALVSGASPAVLKGILSGEIFSPEGIMVNTLANKRYERVVA